METPDRIYFDGNDRACKLPIFSSTNIEYIRADAFIEKALKYIKANVDRIVNNKHGVSMGCMDKDFKKYMED